MKSVRSRLTRQNQISIPAEVRRRLGLVPGSVIEWEENGDTISIRRVGTFSSLDIHKAVFGDEPPPPVRVEAMDDAIAEHLRERYARR